MLQFEWRGEFSNEELNPLHAEGFGHPILGIDWRGQVRAHSLGWVTAREGGELLGFVNVAWDGGVHAFLLDTMVARAYRRRGLAMRLVKEATEQARAAGCEWLHVDFDEELRSFYLDACGFEPAPAGVIRL